MLVSVTVQLVPAARFGNSAASGVRVPSGMVMVVSSTVSPPSVQTTEMTTSPSAPAASPVLVLVTTSAPGAKVYVSVTVAVVVVPETMVTGPGRMVLTSTLALSPLVGSVTVQTVPTGISVNVSVTVPVVSASTVKLNW